VVEARPAAARHQKLRKLVHDPVALLLLGRFVYVQGVELLLNLLVLVVGPWRRTAAKIGVYIKVETTNTILVKTVILNKGTFALK
jgi:hypothetical protein